MASSSWLKTQRSGKISERDILVNRKDSIDKIIEKIGSDFEDNVISINSMLSYCASYYSSGIKGRKNDIYSDISSEREQYDFNDTKLSSCKSNLQNESNRCQSRIDTLNLEITSLDSEIATAEYNEEQERKKAWEDYLASLKGEKQHE